MIALEPGDPLRLRGGAVGDVFVTVREVRRLPLEGEGAALVVDLAGVLHLVEGRASGPTWGAKHDRYELAVTSLSPWPPRRVRAPRRRGRDQAGDTTATATTRTGTEDSDGRG